MHLRRLRPAGVNWARPGRKALSPGLVIEDRHELALDPADVKLTAGDGCASLGHDARRLDVDVHAPVDVDNEGDGRPGEPRGDVLDLGAEYLHRQLDLVRWQLGGILDALFVEPVGTVNVLTQLEAKLTRPPGTIVVSYHLAGLQNGVELPPFGVTIVVGAAQVLQAFLVAHALLHLQRWAVSPDTLDQKVVIHALIPRVLLNVFQVGVLVPVQEEYWRPEHWSRLYLHSTVAPGPNPLQVLAVIAGVARRCNDDWRRAVEAVNNSEDWPGVQTRARRDCKKEPWIGKDMQHNMELIRQGGEAFQQRLQVG